MKKEEKEKEREAVLLLFEAFREEILKEDTKSEKYQRILSLMTASIKCVSKGEKSPRSQANEVYKAVCSLCFVDNIKLNEVEAAALNKIKEFGQTKGLWDTLKRANFSSVGNWIGR